MSIEIKMSSRFLFIQKVQNSNIQHPKDYDKCNTGFIKQFNVLS